MNLFIIIFNTIYRQRKRERVTEGEREKGNNRDKER